MEKHYRDYRQDSEVVTPLVAIKFPYECYQFFQPGEQIDIVDLCILDYIYHLSLGSFASDSDMADLAVFNIAGKLYFEVSFDEFLSKYKYLQSECIELSSLTFNNKLYELVKKNLLEYVYIEECELKVYSVTNLYCDLFMGM